MSNSKDIQPKSDMLHAVYLIWSEESGATNQEPRPALYSRFAEAPEQL